VPQQPFEPSVLERTTQSMSRRLATIPLYAANERTVRFFRRLFRRLRMLSELTLALIRPTLAFSTIVTGCHFGLHEPGGFRFLFVIRTPTPIEELLVEGQIVQPLPQERPLEVHSTRVSDEVNPLFTSVK